MTRGRGRASLQGAPEPTIVRAPARVQQQPERLRAGAAARHGHLGHGLRRRLAAGHRLHVGWRRRRTARPWERVRWEVGGRLVRIRRGFASRTSVDTAPPRRRPPVRAADGGVAGAVARRRGRVW